ncbi:pyruvate dehydrogenase (acetyl-transferring) E1 component subunit alpha [Polycladomyces subterraneus]|uniref:Pyruvate dehydrogenase E1 component subunit alpha n=1 Tax=Polycladomyces subterraneus TaxID=1016997 RepID=A0ABT8IMD1_9BACL|nr:pyruvate dehydrogenase (acetyl-transferring) E1 component subunit alpha [Polycladomyces subterraneus]MDN4593949.1 pyruvate dehydrogenase (acetyl-transferring) E1 component subunit alpha [Polycladomyces subterraneus]
MLRQMEKVGLQYLQPDGTLTPEGEVAWKPIERPLKIEFYKWMRKIRLFDQRAVILQRQGRIGTYAPLQGQEAAQVGSALALNREDWIFPSYREHGVAMIAGMPLKQILLYWMGRVEGCRPPEGVKLFPPAVPIATQIPHAAGAAWASKLKGEPSVAVAYFGDGATSEGDFHEGLNFAGVFRLPVIFFCQNNQYAISVPFSRQTATETVAEKAAAYAIRGVRVDGNDVLAVYTVMNEAVERARTGEGATLIEAVTYRHGAHTTADDAGRYREQEEAREWVELRDPLTRYRKLLEAEGLWSEAEERDWEACCKQEIEEAVRAAESAEAPPASHLFAHVFADLPPSLVRQREPLLRQEEEK